MKCPRCNLEVRFLWGSGDYPNDSYRCEYCHDKELGRAISCFVLVLAAIVLGIILWSLCDGNDNGGATPSLVANRQPLHWLVICFPE